jgi:hypothetical protein
MGNYAHAQILVALFLKQPVRSPLYVRGYKQARMSRSRYVYAHMLSSLTMMLFAGVPSAPSPTGGWSP